MTTSTASTIQSTIWQDATPEAQVNDVIRRPFTPIARVVGKEVLKDGRTCLIVEFPNCRDLEKEEWVLPAVEVVPELAPTPATSETDQQPPGRGNGRKQVQAIAKPNKVLTTTNVMSAPHKQGSLERPPTPEEKRVDEVAEKFAKGWENWNVFDTGYFLKYKRPHTLTRKQVDWLRNVYVQQFKWGVSRDKAYDRPSMDNMGSTYQREFMWQVSVHANGSGTFEILVKK